MKTKLEEFVKRNRRRNKQLYADDAIAGYDYVICPVSNARKTMIEAKYITATLGMTTEEYDLLYPDIQKIATARLDKIKQGLHQIDENTGLTKYQLSQLKAKESLQSIGDDGLSGYARKGKKTRQTHMNNVDEFGRNGYSQLATKAIIKGNETKASKGMILPPEVRNEFYRYKLIVTYLTERLRKNISNGYVTGLAGQDGAYHIDHVYSIMQGYINKVSPFVIGNIKNLKMIPWEENLEKHSSSNIKLEELLDKIEYTLEESINEFNFAIRCIQIDMENNSTSSGAKIAEQIYETIIRNKHPI